MQRDLDLSRSSVPLYDCPPRIHLDPSFVRDHIETVLLEQGYKGDVKAAAERIESRCRAASERS